MRLLEYVDAFLGCICLLQFDEVDDTVASLKDPIARQKKRAKECVGVKMLDSTEGNANVV